MQHKEPPKRDYVHRVRRATGMTQEEIAEKLDLGVRTVQRKLKAPDWQFLYALEFLASQITSS